MGLTQVSVNKILARVRRLYSDWQDVAHPRFVADELDYKRAARGRILETLGADQFRQLIESRQHDEIIEWLGDRTMLPSVIDMPGLFERFVAAWLATHMPPPYRVEAQERIEVVPDKILCTISSRRCLPLSYMRA